MTYKLVKDKETGEFMVVEIETNHIMHKSDNHDKAHKLYRHLKEGGGFDGNTPSFMFYNGFSVK